MNDQNQEPEEITELKRALKRWNWSKEDIAKLASGDVLGRVRDVVRGESKIIPLPFFSRVGEMDLVVDSKPFIVKEHFFDELLDWLFLDDEFKRLFHGVVEEPQVGRKVLAFQLKSVATTSNLVRELDGPIKSGTMLWVLWLLLVPQCSGDKGLLTTDGRNNIFFLRGGGSLSVATVCFKNQIWEADAFQVGDEVSWHPGDRVFVLE